MSAESSSDVELPVANSKRLRQRRALWCSTVLLAISVGGLVYSVSGSDGDRGHRLFGIVIVAWLSVVLGFQIRSIISFPAAHEVPHTCDELRE